MMHARVSQTCRSSCFDVVIDLLHAVHGMSATPLLCTSATRPRPVQSSPSAAWTSSDFIVRIYGKNRTISDSTQHRTTYGPSTAKSRLQLRQRRALELIEQGRRHRSNADPPEFHTINQSINMEGKRYSALHCRVEVDAGALAWRAKGSARRPRSRDRSLRFHQTNIAYVCDAARLHNK